MTVSSKYDLDDEVRIGGRRAIIQHIEIRATRSCYFQKDTCAIKYQVQILMSGEWVLSDFWEDDIDS